MRKKVNKFSVLMHCHIEIVMICDTHQEIHQLHIFKLNYQFRAINSYWLDSFIFVDNKQMRKYLKVKFFH